MTSAALRENANYHAASAARALESSMSECVDLPRAMRDPHERSRRRALLRLPHVAALTQYAEDLRRRRDWQVPDFDPLDGGVEAEAMWLFEKPGPQAAASGFISRNNDDPSAEHTFEIMRAIGLPRRRTVTWNVIPGWNETIRFTAAERLFGLQCLGELLSRLPRLRVAVLVGRTAQRAEPYLRERLPVVKSWHPSPKVRARYPGYFQSIPDAWRKVFSHIRP